MILDDILNIWKKRDLLSQAISDCNEMLLISQKFFNMVSEPLINLDSETTFDKEIVKKKDYLLNHFERSIKKKTFEHMSISDKREQNLYHGIITITCSIEIERLGDYCKNIFEVVELKDRLKNGALNSLTKSYLEDLKEMFDRCGSAFVETEKDDAKVVIDKHYTLKTSIDDKLMELALQDNGENFTLYALLFRYLKRVSSHLRNIATAITNPIDKMGFYIEEDE